MDEDLHLGDAVPVDHVPVRQQLLPRKPSARRDDLHLLEDRTLPRLTRPCAGREPHPPS